MCAVASIIALTTCTSSDSNGEYVTDVTIQSSYFTVLWYMVNLLSMITHYNALPDIRTKHNRDIITYASGCFDILHLGHIEQLEFAKTLGDIAVVGVTPDARIRARKGSERPINPQGSRLALINALRSVDYCFITPEELPETPIIGHSIVQRLQPNLLVTHDPYWYRDEDWLSRQGTRIVAGPSPANVSTTQIIDSILDRYRSRDHSC